MFSSLAFTVSILAAAAAGVGLYATINSAYSIVTTLGLLGGPGAIFLPAAALALAAMLLASIGLHLSAKLLGGLAMILSVVVLVASIALFFVYDGINFFQNSAGMDLGDKGRLIWDVFKGVFQSGVKNEVLNAVNGIL